MSLTQVQQGMVGTQTSIPMTYGAIGSGNSSIMKNRIINGAMVIDQRNAGASVTPAASVYTYITDRFSVYTNQSNKLTAQQNAGSVTPPVGFKNYLGITSSSAYSVIAGDLIMISQKIEGYNIADLAWGTASAKTVTLSFQVYSSLTGTFGGALNNANQDRSYPFSYSIPVANTWTTVSITIAGDTTGSWLSTNGTGIQVTWGLGIGSPYAGTAGAWSGTGNYFSSTGAVSVVGTNGATFYITGVQLEVGSSATGFEYVNYQTSLANCQRYFETNALSGQAPADSKPYLDRVVMTAYSGTVAACVTIFAVTKRANPSITYYSGDNAGTAGKWCYYPSGWTGFNSISAGYTRPNGFSTDATGSGMTTYGAYISQGGWTASAEL